MWSLSRLVVIFWVSGNSFASLANLWSACDRDSADFNQCLKNQINSALLFLKDGNKDLRLPQLDPLTLETVVMEDGQGMVPIDLRLSDVTIRGLSKLRVTNVTTESMSLELTYSMDRFEVEGQYSLKANLMVLPVSASGPCAFSYENMTATISVDLSAETKDGKTFFQVEDLSVYNDAESFTMNVQNLFNGEKHFDSIMNKFLNKNCKHMVAEGMAKAQAKIFSDMANMIFSGIPIEVQHRHSTEL